MRRKTSADYRLLAEKRGFRWLGFEATNTHTKTSWACEQGHQWQAPYSSIQQGRGCPVCAGRMPKTAADYRALAEKRGFHLLGPEASNTKTKTNWGCEQGHRWEAPYHNIQQGHGCPICAGNIPKTSIDYHALAEKRGFRWLGPKVSNVLTKTGWECEQGHQWKAPYNSIQQERGCPVCAGKVPKSPVDYHALAEERGFRWLGPGVADTMTRTSWECEQRHRWETPYSSIQQGRGCPVCAGRVAKTPADYHALAEERGFLWLGPEVADTKTKTSWECEKSHRWEAPFNSIQQGRSCPFCAGLAPKTTADYRALAKERGFCWLGPEVSNTHTKTSWECEKSHRWEAPYSSIQQGSGCPFCAGLAPKTPADYHDLAKERGFHWLGPEVSNTKTKTSWECAQGHHWEAPYHDIQQGYGCLICAGKAPKTPADYHDLVKERGIHWLGPKVPNVSTKTSWKCEQGHRGEAPYSSIQQGSGCPFCAGLVPKIPADYHDLAKERGFHWLGPEVSNNRTKTGWECKQGHRWEAPYSSIQQGNGCPFCAGRAPKTSADYRALARERGFHWLGPQVSDTSTKTRWECEQGHRWEAPYSSIQQGSGCLTCAGKAPKTPADYHAVAKRRGFRWLGPEVSNISTKTNWECEQGHRWEARYNDINRGSGCPACVDMVHGQRVSQVQRELCEMLDGELNRPFGRYNIDVALNVDGVAIAIEYDSWFWHGHKLEYDAQRDKEMIAIGWRILRVKSNTLLPSREQLDAAIAHLLAGENWVELVLDDWGEGQTRFGTD